MTAPYLIQGHAIVSDDDKIADSSGKTPQALRNKADWRRFQTALDRAAVSVLGRKGHQDNPNVNHRNRLVLSSGARGIERRDESWWWNPAEATLEQALAAAAPDGGIVAVTGGRAVFDLFLDLGFDEFHLVRAHGVTVSGGERIFSECGPERPPEAVLAAHGLSPESSEVLDATAKVTLTVWKWTES